MCVPILAVLNALTKCGSLSQWRVPTTAGTGGKDAILQRRRETGDDIRIEALDVFSVKFS